MKGGATVDTADTVVLLLTVKDDPPLPAITVLPSVDVKTPELEVLLPVV
jgi:hypothetical protein